MRDVLSDSGRWYNRSYGTSEEQKDVLQLILQYEDDKNAMIATVEQADPNLYEEFYEELDNRIVEEVSMDILYFGSVTEFLRIDSESLLHILHKTDKDKIPISRTLLAWDMITDGKTPAYLQGREYMSFDTLLNVVPESDLYYVNFGDPSVLKYFSNNVYKLKRRKCGILAAAYRRYYGETWLENATHLNDLGYLICGFPPSDLSKIPPSVFKDISIDILNKLKKCSPRQTQALYNIAIKDEAFGKPYSWTSHEIGKLGHLFTHIPKEDISSLQLQAMSGITKQVMMDIQQKKLGSFTNRHVMRMNQHARRMYILRTQLKYSLDMDQISKQNNGLQNRPIMLICWISIILTILF